MALYPRVPIYLFYGTQTDRILHARDTVLDLLLPKEMRGESLTEYTASGKEFGVKLADVLPEIAGDLSTMSFISEAPKVAVVYNPAELFSASAASRRKKAAKKKKAAKSSKPAAESSEPQGYVGWLQRELPRVQGHIILLAFEEEGAGREVNDKHPLLQVLGRLGHTQHFRDKKAFFAIEDALLRRDLDGTLAAVETLWKPGKGDATVYSALVRSMRFMLQAKILAERRDAKDPTMQALYFPSGGQFSVLKSAPFVQKKYLQRPIPYRTVELLEAYKSLLGVYEALRPRPGTTYVPDARLLLERALVELMTSPK